MEYISYFWNSIISVINTFSLADVIDIILVFYLVYKGINVVKETRAEQLVKGIILLSLAFFFVNIFGLKTIGFLLENIFQIGIIAIIVMFQPELRRALEKVGRTKVSKLTVFGGNTDDNVKKALILKNIISIVVNSVDSMSKSKTGALIVFERQTKLGEQISTGVCLNAKISKELVENIFFHNSPLHDGAIIIRDNLILAAACFLPKPQNEEFIDRKFGARHRAAIGMSENSDAIVIIVSEEKGTVSVSDYGQIFQKSSKEELLSFLTKKLISDNFKSVNNKKSSKFWRLKNK